MDLCYDEQLVYLKTFGKNLVVDVEKFYEVAMSFKITKQMCKDLDKVFYNEKNPRYIYFNEGLKKWMMPS